MCVSAVVCCVRDDDDVGGTEGWAAHSKWSEEGLLSNYGDVKFSVGQCEVRLRDYLHYCHLTSEERPVYLFDKQVSLLLSLSVCVCVCMWLCPCLPFN